MGGWVSLRENSLALSADTFRLSWGCEVGGDTQKTPVTRDVEAVPPPFFKFSFSLSIGDLEWAVCIQLVKERNSYIWSSQWYVLDWNRSSFCSSPNTFRAPSPCRVPSWVCVPAAAKSSMSLGKPFASADLSATFCEMRRLAQVPKSSLRSKGLGLIKVFYG